MPANRSSRWAFSAPFSPTSNENCLMILTLTFFALSFAQFTWKLIKTVPMNKISNFHATLLSSDANIVFFFFADSDCCLVSTQKKVRFRRRMRRWTREGRKISSKTVSEAVRKKTKNFRWLLEIFFTIRFANLESLWLLEKTSTCWAQWNLWTESEDLESFE